MELSNWKKNICGAKGHERTALQQNDMMKETLLKKDPSSLGFAKNGDS